MPGVVNTRVDVLRLFWFWRSPSSRHLCYSVDRKIYDVVIIGGGHAGVEASCATVRLGVSTLLVTQELNTIGKLTIIIIKWYVKVS